MNTDDISRLTDALRTVCAELDALSLGPGAAGSAVASSTEPSPHAGRYREAVRQAALALERSRTSLSSTELAAVRRALESLLLEVPR
ncbi:MAG: hypothetical protein ABIT71_02250 [Vicinamibacteraceae bacterium]